MYSYNDELEKAEKEYGFGKSIFFQLKEGLNKVRILTKGVVIASHFAGGKFFGTCYGIEKGCFYHGENALRDKKGQEIKPAVKWLMWVIDREDGEIKQAKFGHTIMTQLRDLQQNPDYQFEDLPMPYDITIMAKNTGTMEAKYSVQAARENISLTENEMSRIMELEDPEEIIQKIKEIQILKDSTNEEINVYRKQLGIDLKMPSEIRPEDAKIEYPEEEIDPEEIPF